MIHVVLADDHPALRVGLRVLLERDGGIEVVAEADDGRQAVEAIRHWKPEVVVLDCQMPALDGRAVIAETDAGSGPAFLALSAYSDEATVRRMVTAGASGYLLKDEAPASIVEAVRVVAGGGHYFSSSVAGIVAALARGQRVGGLTEREEEVLAHIAAGRSNREIAHRLDVTERTVVFHVSNILAKLDLGSRVEAAIWARERGMS